MVTSSNNLKQKYSLAWNSAAESFGLANKSGFMRLDFDGFPIGGTVSIANSHKEISDYQGINGNWHILQATSSKKTYCSKINKYGIEECDQIRLEFHNGSIFEGATILGVDKSRGDLFYAPFDSDTCTMERSKLFASVKEGKIETIHNHIKVDEQSSALLLEVGSETLVLGFVNTSGEYKLDSQVSVVSGNDISQAQVAVVRDKVLVSYIDSNRLYLSYSTQGVSEK
ncbi:MAG: hypothetical protein AB8G05_05480 [Oligoflexales bacterium]